MSYDTWKTTNPDDEWLGPDPYDEILDQPRPCDFDHLSGECLICCAQIGEPCALGWGVNE